MVESFPELVRAKWVSLLTHRDFTVTEEEPRQVVLDSPRVRVVATYDPRGEVDVWVLPHDRATWEGWSYTGMVGTASVDRLLELALTRMETEPEILRGDSNFYDGLAERARGNGEAWTGYYSGRGRRPGRDRLP